MCLLYFFFNGVPTFGLCSKKKDDTLSFKECNICLESLMVNPTRTTCNHYFCENCIKHWVLIKNSCPTCRTKNPIYTDDKC